MSRKKKPPHPLFHATIDLKTYDPRAKSFPTKRVTYGIVDSGHAIGEAHHRAKLSDSDVELIRDIYDEGMASYGTLAQVFEVSKYTIRDIVTFRRRASTPEAFRTVEVGKRRPMPKSRLETLGIDPAALDALDDWDDNH